jgi:hypothetical protein
VNASSSIIRSRTAARCSADSRSSSRSISGRTRRTASSSITRDPEQPRMCLLRTASPETPTAGEGLRERLRGEVERDLRVRGAMREEPQERLDIEAIQRGEIGLAVEPAVTPATSRS